MLIGGVLGSVVWVGETLLDVGALKSFGICHYTVRKSPFRFSGSVSDSCSCLD